jgi:hypothetical protein
MHLFVTNFLNHWCAELVALRWLPGSAATSSLAFLSGTNAPLVGNCLEKDVTVIDVVTLSRHEICRKKRTTYQEAKELFD